MTKSGITFWQLPSDEEGFLSFLSATTELVAYTAPWKEKPEDVQPVSLSNLVLEQGPTQLMFGPKSGSRPIEAHSFEGRILYNVRLETSSLIMYRRGKLQERTLVQSNLSVYWAYLELQTRQFVRKEEQFISWSKSVLAWMRKETPEWYEHKRYRATRAVKFALGRGEIELRRY